MDPDEALKRIRQAIRFVNQDSAPTNFGAIEELIALDDWLTNGGFLPEDWQYRADD